MCDLMVSVGMLAYNHGKFIGQAIESVVEQECTFRFELVIAEDCSSDNTLSVIMEYKEKYPKIIRVLQHKHNLGMAGNTSALVRELKGKYTAWCEGDDFWCDKHKLEKQVEYLENHSDIFATMHNVYVVNADGEKTGNNTCFPYREEFEYSRINAEKFEMAGQINSMVNRNIYKEWSSDQISKFYSYKCNGDQMLEVLCGMSGGIFYSNEYMSCYRLIRDEGTSYSALTNGKNRMVYYYDSMKSLNQMLIDYFGVNQNIDERLMIVIKSSFLLALKHPTEENKIAFETLYNLGDYKHTYIIKSIMYWILTYPVRLIKRCTSTK